MADPGFVACLDVGGTRIKVGLVDSALQVIESSLREVDSCSDREAEVILDHLAGLVVALSEHAAHLGGSLHGVGLGFPGPFDYENGVPLLRGLAKYESLYGLSLRSALAPRLPRLPLRFENDAALFALGEARQRPELSGKRLIFLTLGTGCGSSFIVDGHLVKGRDGVPANGMLFDQPYRGGVVDDFLSRRGVLALANESGARFKGLDVKPLADRARSGDTAALAVFQEFGRRLTEVLRPYQERFRPDLIVLGGGIARSHDLFGVSWGAPVELSRASSSSTLIGAAALFREVNAGEPE